MEVEPATLRVLLQPQLQPRPLLEERLVHELDAAVVGHEEPPFDQNRQHARDLLVAVGVELGATDTPSRQRLASTTGYQPKQDSARDLPLVLAKRPERSVGVPADCAADTAAPLVGGERES